MEPRKLRYKLFYAIGIADFAAKNIINYDFTGVAWSPWAFGLIGLICYFFYYKNLEKFKFSEGEELLTLSNGKKAEAKITIGIGGGTGSSRKLYLTNLKLVIKGYEKFIELPYSEIKSVSKDTRMGIEMLLNVDTYNNEEYKFAFGFSSSKRNNFLKAILKQLSEVSYVDSHGVQSTEFLVSEENQNKISNTNYYYFDKSVGEVIGPKTKTEMERLRFENRISDQTQVTEAGVESWQPFQSAIG